MSSSYENSGTLNPTREKRSDRSPDFYGRLQISGEVLAALNAGKHVRISGWNRTGKYGEFISLAVDVERPKASASEAGGYDWKQAEAKQRTAADNVRESQSAPLEFDDALPPF